MSTIAVPIPDEDLRFLRAWTAEQGISAEAFLAQQARNLREHVQRGLHPIVSAARGVISEDTPLGYMEHLERKHE